MYLIIRKILFLFPPEKAHYLTSFLASIWYAIPSNRVKIQHQSIQQMGLNFQNRIGLAAGFDKNATMLTWLSALGFGFIEIGTVTPKPQEGNPKPRLFRLKKDQALINRMGFNNQGLEQIVQNLKKRPQNIIIGGNIGKNKSTPNEKAVDDYITCFDGLFDYVDYFVVNVSSPNTPGLRELQEKDALLSILSALQNKNIQKSSPKPILLKIAPDLTKEQLDDIVTVVRQSDIQGVIASNTTLDRSSLTEDTERIGPGGLSGKPLEQRSTEIISYLRANLSQQYTIIGVGGIFSQQDAERKIKAGANLVQVYTGFIYEGPKLIQQLASL